MKGRISRLTINLVVAAAALIVGFMVPELLLRIFRPAFTNQLFDEGRQVLPGLQDFVAITQSYERSHNIVQPPNFIEASDLLWSLVPGYRGDITRLPPLAGEHPTWRLEVNALGLRGDLPSGRTDLFRVLCLGDSITFGDKLDEDRTYPAALGRILEARWPDRRVEVINAGIPGYSSHQGILLWHRLRRLKPSVVVVSFGQNDVWQSMVSDRESLPIGESLIGNIRVQLGRTAVYRALRAALLSARRRVAKPSAPGKPVPTQRRVDLEETSQNVRRLVREARAAGARAIVLHTAFGNPEIAAALEAAARAEGAAYVDGKAVFDSARAAKQRALADRLKLRGVCAHGAGGSSGYALRVRFLEGTEPEGEVVASTIGLPPWSVLASLTDDGRGCDENKGDGVFTGLVEAPPGRALRFVFGIRSQSARALGEFQDFPLTWRRLIAGKAQGGGPRVGPVEIYGRFSLMSEGVHPDAEGAAILAGAVAEAIP